MSQIPYGIVIHGGAGNLTALNTDTSKINAYSKVLNKALDTAWRILDAGGMAEDAVVAAISVLEDSELFNAGRGSVLSHDGTVRMDASIMNGRDLSAGAVTELRHTKNPILCAKAVKDHTPHVMISGVEADEFAREMGLEQKPQSYFITEEKQLQLKKAIERDKTELDHNGSGWHNNDGGDSKYGTVGAVALDKHGNICAGTSTGGMTNKKYGRIGDSPIIGAGTYANNASCGISCTGHGEYFIRLAVAHEIESLVRHNNISLDEAAKQVIHKDLAGLGGMGGVIGIDRQGKVCVEFNTPGMIRAWRTSKDEKSTVGFF
ncbi:MAG: isoaspartyl peptidase/L-asparaginase [Salibacteraceae bacterium]